MMTARVTEFFMKLFLFMQIRRLSCLRYLNLTKKERGNMN